MAQSPTCATRRKDQTTLTPGAPTATPSRYAYKATLRARYGLTDKWIARLGSPDKTATNPHFASAAPSSLYLIERVETYLDAHQGEYEEMLTRLAPRRAAASKEAPEWERLVEWAKRVPIEWHGPEWGCGLDTLGLSLGVNDRMLQARLRHRHTNYEALLAQMDGLVKRSTKRNAAHLRAYGIIKQCANQLVERMMGVLSWQPDRTIWA